MRRDDVFLLWNFLNVTPLQITSIGIRTAGHACAFQGFSIKSVTKDSLILTVVENHSHFPTLLVFEKYR